MFCEELSLNVLVVSVTRAAESTVCSHKPFRLHTRTREKWFLPPTSSTPSSSMSLVKLEIWPVKVDRLPPTWPRDWPRPEPSPPSHEDILTGGQTRTKTSPGGGLASLWPKPDQDRSRHEVRLTLLFRSVLFPSLNSVEVSADPNSFKTPNPANNSCFPGASEAALAAF